MQPFKLSFLAAIFLSVALTLSSCFNDPDPGPLQSDERDYAILDFDRLEMGDYFVINVQQSPVFSIRARCDRRKLDDLKTYKVGSTLKIEFPDSRSRDYATYIDIKMPKLKGINFSGVSNSIVTGFRDEDQFEVILSGASISQLDFKSESAKIILTGASQLTTSGITHSLTSRISGGALLNAYNLPVSTADIEVSGASGAKVNVATSLKAVASGGSFIYFRGDAGVNASTSGASVVRAD
jgi:hypothetical protein